MKRCKVNFDTRKQSFDVHAVNFIDNIAYKNQFKYVMYVYVACALRILFAHRVTNLSPLSKLKKMISGLNQHNSFCTAVFGKNYIKLYFESHKNTKMTIHKCKMETCHLENEDFFCWYAMCVIPTHIMQSCKFIEFRQTIVVFSISTAQIHLTRWQTSGKKQQVGWSYSESREYDMLMKHCVCSAGSNCQTTTTFGLSTWV